MARIKIEDLSVLEDLSKKETKGIFGGVSRDSDPVDNRTSDGVFVFFPEPASASDAGGVNELINRERDGASSQ